MKISQSFAIFCEQMNFIGKFIGEFENRLFFDCEDFVLSISKNDINQIDSIEHKVWVTSEGKCYTH